MRLTRSLLHVLLLCIPCAVHAAADVILAGGTIHTMDPKRPTATAVAIDAGRFVYVGGLEGVASYRGRDTRWIDLGDMVALPGLTDAHGHLRNLGRILANLNLVGTGSKNEILGMVRAFQKKVPPKRWIRGRGWDQNDWEAEEFPTWKDLAGTERNPVYLRRVDGHACWVNRTAMDLCDITRDTRDPDGGRIIRFPDGAPTGVFIDNATALITAHIPDPSDSELDGWMLSAIAECNRYGLTGVHDGGITKSMLASLKRLGDAGKLTLRIYCMLSTRDDAFISEEFARGPQSYFDDLLNVRAFKIYADGALGSRGAALLAPYDDDPGNTGLLLTPPAKVLELIERGFEAGFQPCTHAIGDRGNRVTLDAYERVLAEHPSGDYRFRIEHCQVLSPEDIARFARLGVIPSMQPTHATSDMYWAVERIGEERLAGAYAWRRLIEAGNRIPFGSDFPVEGVNPLWGIYAAVTRMDQKGWPEGGWRPEERVTIEEAVAGFTTNAAFARFAEDDLGTISVGKRADVTVFDRDVFSVPPRELLETHATLTIVGGEVVYGELPGSH